MLSLGCFGDLTAEEVIRAHEIAVSIEDRLLFSKRSRGRTLDCVCHRCGSVQSVRTLGVFFYLYLFG